MRFLKTANVGFRRNDARASRMTATSARKVYDSLLGQGFRASDIEDAMRDACDATGGSFVEADALDRLCMNVPNARLPRRFQTVERSEFKLDADASGRGDGGASDGSGAETRLRGAGRAHDSSDWEEGRW